MNKPQPHPTVDLFDLNICRLSFDQASAELVRAARACQQAGAASKVVVTPNVDHLVRLTQQTEFRQRYATADYIFADGMPVVWASRWFGKALPERVTGADLFVSLCQQAIQDKLKVFVLGGMPGEEASLLADFAKTYPGLELKIRCPAMGFDAMGAEADLALQDIKQWQPQILFICLGMPKQEQFALRYRELSDVPPCLCLCVGAAMEFALGKKSRAPRWMQKAGLEWSWRLVSEPRRLARRYIVQGWGFLGLLWRERGRKTASR